MSIQLENERNLQDPSFYAQVTLPNAANTNVTTTAFNLGSPTFSGSEHYGVQVDIDPLANFGTAGALNVIIQDSADNVTFANIQGLGPITVSANTAATTTYQYRLPSIARQYIRSFAAVTGINGNIAANNLTFSVRF